MRVVVVGAGVSGLGAGLMLAEAGHEVVLLERDATPLPHSSGEAFGWKRRGAPQVHHSHAFLARGRNLIRDRMPEVRQALLEAGVSEVRWADMIPETIEDASPKPGDEDLVMLACRRTTFEWVLRKVVAGRIHLDDGVTVTGLLHENGTSDRPARISGVRTEEGDIAADLVVDATGRAGHLVEMLAALGVRTAEEKSNSGIVYLSRFYHLNDGATPPDPMPFNGADLGYMKFAVFRGDNDTFSITLAYGSDDHDLQALRQPARFEAALRLVPIIEPWVDPGVSAPSSDVHYMGGLINRKRTFVCDGRPVVLGFHAVGDSAVCTNPLYGRGCSLGLVHGALLTDALSEHGDDLEALAVAFDEATSRELLPWYEAAVAQDKTGQKVARGEELNDFEQFMRSVLLEGVFPASRVDADVSRAWMRSFNLLSTPEAVFTDVGVMRRVLEFYETREEREPPEPRGPQREPFLASLAAATT